VAFLAVYPTLNWVTSLRPDPLHLYLRAELALPFVPQFIWVYLSMYVLFLAPPLVLPAEHMPALGKQLVAGTLAGGLLFLLFPAELGFARALPSGAPYAEIYAAVFRVDHPYNLVPSLHVAYSTAIALACTEVSRPLLRVALHGWWIAIAISTVLVHQHHVLDVVAAFVLVFLLRSRFKVPHA